MLIDSVPGTLLGLRQNLVMMESSFPQEATNAFKGLETKGNPWGLGPDRRLEWAEGLDVPLMSEQGGREVEYLLWVGCAGATDPRARKTNQALVRILKAAGVDFATLGTEERCNGDPARRLGNEYVFAELAKENVETLKPYRFRKMLVTCPHCLNSLGKEYREHGGEYQVVHHSQLLSELLAAGRIPLDLATSGQELVTFHDPCYLARYNDTVAEPREVLTRIGAKPVEMANSGKTGFCCGAGGGRIFLEERIGKRVNIERTEQALATGASTVAVGCPFCMTMMTDGTKAKGVDDKVKVKDLAELVAERLQQRSPDEAPCPGRADAARGRRTSPGTRCRVPSCRSWRVPASAFLRFQAPHAGSPRGRSRALREGGCAEGTAGRCCPACDLLPWRRGAGGGTRAGTSLSSAGPARPRSGSARRRARARHGAPRPGCGARRAMCPSR